ncbi:hypothetical protein E2C01_093200 [Portunus trituberculatus]|uniref:Uncharacterized protein n=1 Tax=Portunus trituberculatus TaxID=210409 RepID=A0A5B7JP61_PORTR|nr:hypothetical protein [Portunus trituberculatus]
MSKRSFENETIIGDSYRPQLEHKNVRKEGSCKRPPGLHEAVPVCLKLPYSIYHPNP